MGDFIMWVNVFEDVFEKNQGAGHDEVTDFLKTWNVQLSELEIQEMKSRQVQYNQYITFDPYLWDFPQRQLPCSYIEFIQYSNGGEFQTGDRYFQYFSIKEFREYNLAYEFPEYMKFAVSFGMDGCGNHYIFDMREEMKNNEYPILVAHSGYLDYEGSVKVADSFLELCKGRTSMDDEMDKC
jgi:hypothetical protein